MRRVGHVEDGAPLKVAAVGHTESRQCALGIGRAKHRSDLIRRPREERTLAARGVGILRRGECTTVHTHLAQQVPGDGLGRRRVCRIVKHPCTEGVVTQKERVVVQHLLEVGHQPDCVHGVAVEPATDLIEHPTGCHGPQGASGHATCIRIGRIGPCAAQQEVECQRWWELGCSSEPAIHHVVPLVHGGQGLADDLPATGSRRRRHGVLLLDAPRQHPRLLHHLATALTPGLGHTIQDLQE